VTVRPHRPGFTGFIGGEILNNLESTYDIGSIKHEVRHGRERR
jgi:hypothetical protein